MLKVHGRSVFQTRALRELEESPISEYQRRLDERRTRAEERLTAFLGLFGLGLAVTVGSWFATPRGSSPVPVALLPALISVAGASLALVGAAMAALETVRNWTLLPRRLIFAGLFPWAAVVVAATWFLLLKWL